MNPKLILASQSPRRRELLAVLGVPFEIQSSQATEKTTSEGGPRELAKENARLKALDVARQNPDDWILGSDTVVALGNQIFGKPKSRGEAEAMLQSLQGQSHEVFTGVCVINQSLASNELWSDVTKVGFRRLNEEQIGAYLDQMNPLDKAGAYAIQERGERIVSHVEGSLSNVVGLPLESVEAVLAKLGIK